jgi:hypothetical protein
VSVGEAVRTCQWERKAEHDRGRGRQNMLVRKEGRTCLWEMQSEHVSRRGRKNMPVGEEDRTCQRERQPNMLVGE